VETPSVVSAILNSDHHNVQDFRVTIPAAHCAKQQRIKRYSHTSWSAIAAISLLVGASES